MIISASASAIDPPLLQAYLDTEYRVHGRPGFVLRVGHPSAELLALHDREKVDCSALVTACNPFSKPNDATINTARQAALAEELGRQGLVCLPGVGQHPSNAWPGEESFLVLGLELEIASALGRKLEQNALVWSGADAVPQLILLR